MTHPLHSRIISSILCLDDVDPLELSRQLAGDQLSLAVMSFSMRCLDLSAAIRLARGGCHSGTPFEDVADAAQRALTDADAVAAWVCAPIALIDTSGV